MSANDFGSIIEAICTAPVATDGLPSSTWRIALQILVAKGGARVGKSTVGTARVGGYTWFDITGSLNGNVRYNRGTTSQSKGLPRAVPSTMSFSLDNNDGAFSSWKPRTVNDGNVNSAYMHREFTPGAIIRLVRFKSTASTSWSIGANGITTVTRTDWQPLYTGCVDSWDETRDLAENQVQVVCTETLTRLNYTTAPYTSQGAGDTLYQRVIRLINAEGVGYAFGITISDQWSGGTDFWDTDPLDATTMSDNRLNELYTAGDSLRNTMIFSASDGSIRIGVPKSLSVTALNNSTPPSTSASIPHFIPYSSSAVASDGSYFPNQVLGIYTPPLRVSNNRAGVINYAAVKRPAGATKTAQTNESIALFGVQSYERSDLQGDEGMSTVIANNALTYDNWNATHWYVDQTLQPGVITVIDQHSLQAAAELYTPCIVDVQDTASAIGFRMLGRIFGAVHTLTRLADGFMWRTDFSVLATTNYVPGQAGTPS